MTTTIKIEMANNSDARRADVLRSIRGASCRHNGGKIVIATVDSDDLDAARELLEESHAVKSFEVRS